MNSSARAEQESGSPTSTSLSGEIHNGTQGSINTKKRMKWTREMNTEIIKCHFKALITVPNTYSKGLLEYFERKYQSLHVTTQQLTDQKRAILERAYGKVKGKLRGGWLSRDEVEVIEGEAKILYDNEESTRNRNEEALTEHVENLSAGNTDEIQEPETDEARAIITRVKIEFDKTKMTGFDNRKRIRKPPKKIFEKLKESITKINNILKGGYISVNDFTEQNCLLYAASVIAIEIAGLTKECLTTKRRKNEKRNDTWENKIKRKIEILRSDISKIVQMCNSAKTPRIKRNSAEMRRKYKLYSDTKRKETSERLKQRLSALSHGLKRFQKRQKQFHQNHMFENDPQRCYKQLREAQSEVDDPPNKEDIENFSYQSMKRVNRTIQHPKGLKITKIMSRHHKSRNKGNHNGTRKT